MSMTASPPEILGVIDGPDTCRICGEPGLRTELVRNPFICGTGGDPAELVVEFPVHTCSACDMSYRSAQAAAIEHAAVCRHLGFLTPEEVRGIRSHLDMSRADFAGLTGLGEATIARWERGEVIQNRANDRLLRMLRHPAGRRLLEEVIVGAGENERDSSSSTGDEVASYFGRTVTGAASRPSVEVTAEVRALRPEVAGNLRVDFSPRIAA